VTYVGTRWGQTARSDPEAFATVLLSIIAKARIAPTGTALARGHVDVLRHAGAARLVIGVAGDAPTTIQVDLPGRWRGRFDGVEGSLRDGITVAAGTAELFVPV
jgi:hypothetical protein